MKRAVLDTNAYAAMRRGKKAAHEAIAAKDEILLSTVVIGELLYGFRGGSMLEANARGLRAFVDDAHVRVLDVDADTADWFARIADQLKKKGTPIPTNDIWIAAHAAQHGAEVLTYDAHFARIDGLAVQLLA